MTIARVLQKKGFDGFVDERPPVMDRFDFTWVADVEVGDVNTYQALEIAFRKTNSVDEAWYERDDITVIGKAKGGCRSTSEGDLVELNGLVYRCGFFGWDIVEFKAALAA